MKNTYVYKKLQKYFTSFLYFKKVTLVYDLCKLYEFCKSDELCRLFM